MYANSNIFLILTSSTDIFKLRADFYGFLVGIRNNSDLLYMQAPSDKVRQLETIEIKISLKVSD